MPWAADRIADERSLGERAVVVGAFRSDREQSSATAREQHRLIPDMPQEHRALGEIRSRDPLCQIGSGGLSFLFAHDGLLLARENHHTKIKRCPTPFGT